MSLNLEEKVVRQRLSVLELAQALGNVSEACRTRDTSPPPISAQAGRRALLLAYAAIESFNQGQRVAVGTP